MCHMLHACYRGASSFCLQWWGRFAHTYVHIREVKVLLCAFPLHSSEFATLRRTSFRASVYAVYVHLRVNMLASCTHVRIVIVRIWDIHVRREEKGLAKTENSIEMYRSKTKLRELRASACARPLSTLVNRDRLANSRFSATVAAPAVLTRTRFTT